MTERAFLVVLNSAHWILLPVCFEHAMFLVKTDIRRAAPRIPVVSRFPLSHVVEQLVKSLSYVRKEKFSIARQLAQISQLRITTTDLDFTLYLLLRSIALMLRHPKMCFAL